MIVDRPPPDDAGVEKRISWAERVFHRLGTRLLIDERITRLLERLKTAIAESRSEMSRTGIVALCAACEQREGGSCCGAGMESRYSATLLLINLLLGVRLPEERINPSSCFFLGNEGCRLLARHVICVNYLCKKITDRVSIPQLAVLREKEGVELEVLFLLNECLRDILESRFYSPGSLDTSQRDISLDDKTRKTLRFVANFYDQRKVGDTGYLGFRRSTDLSRLSACLDSLIEKGLLVPGESLFLDMGCGDGRVNVLLSYLARKSIGIERDEWTLDEYEPLKEQLTLMLKKEHLPLPPPNIFLFHGDTMDENLHKIISSEAGVCFEDYDIFYTYLTMHEEFGALISRKAKKGALFMVYGVKRILPRFDGLYLLTPQKPLEGILALYQKK